MTVVLRISIKPIMLENCQLYSTFHAKTTKLEERISHVYISYRCPRFRICARVFSVESKVNGNDTNRPLQSQCH